MDAYALEQELRHTPRKVKRRGTHGFGTVFCQWILVPLLMAMTLWMTLWSVHLAIVRASGPIVPCQIVNRYTEYDKEDRKTRHYLIYRYTASGQQHTERELVEQNVYEQQPLQSTLRVQISPIWPGHDSALIAPGNNIWEDVWTLGSASIILIAGMVAMSWFIYIVPSKGPKLISHGVPVRGVLTDKKQSVGHETVLNDLYYEYQPNGSAEVLVGCQRVQQLDWDGANVGENYTVLVDPQNMQQSVLYQYADYQAI